MHEKQVRVLTIFIGILLGLVALITLIEAPDDAGVIDDEESEEFLELAPEVEAATVMAVDISQEGLDLRLVRDGDGWRLDRPLVAPADGAEADQLVDALLRVELGEDLETSDGAQFGLEPAQGQIRLEIDGSDAVTLEVGEDTPVGWRTYVRTGDGVIRSTRTQLSSVLDVQVGDYRRKDVLELDPAGVTTLAMTVDGQGVVLSQSEGRWWVDDALTPRRPADGERVRTLLEGLADLQVDEFPQGAAAPSGGMELRLVQDSGESRLRFGPEAPDGTRLAVVPAQDQVVRVDGAAVADLPVTAAAWWSRQLLDFSAGEVQRIEVTVDSTTFSATRGSNGWEPAAGEGVLRALDEIRVDRSVALDEGASPLGFVALEVRGGQTLRVELLKASEGQSGASDAGGSFALPATELQRLVDALSG